MATKFRQAGTLFVHGTRSAGRLEIKDPGLRALLADWVGRPTLPYVYDNAATIAKGNLFLSFGLRTRRNPEHLDGFVVTSDLLCHRIAWNDTEASRELNRIVRAIMGAGRCEVAVDVDYYGEGKGVIALRRPDAVAVENSQREASAKFARVTENTRQYRTPSEHRA